MFIDSHCHLNHENFEGLTPPELVARANAAGVNGILTVNVKIASEFEAILEIAKAHERVWCSVGTHPHHADEADERVITQAELVGLANSDPKVVAIGESGLDYYYDTAPVEAQKESFRKHIRACIETDLPLIVHARDADDDIMNIIREEGAGTALKGVMHCFSSGAAMAEDALDFGFYLSFSGIVSFKNAQNLRDIASRVPMDRLLVETDSPYLAPVPYRGKLNEPSYVVHTAEVLAGVSDVRLEMLAKHTSENFYRLFDRAAA